jgi:hypothetical protein
MLEVNSGFFEKCCGKFRGLMAARIGFAWVKEV